MKTCFSPNNDTSEITKKYEDYLNRIKDVLFDINWKTTNPGEQLTGSFNPQIETEQEWYGGTARPP